MTRTRHQQGTAQDPKRRSVAHPPRTSPRGCGMGSATGAASDDVVGGPLSDPLVPIRLNIVVGGQHVQESFTWNALEPSVTPEAFAGVLAADLGLGDGARTAVAASIREQVAAFVPARARRADADESRQVVRLDLRLGRVLVRDQFEWDLTAPANCPESFAAQLCADLGLAGRPGFAPAVAHAVREQLNDVAEFADKRPPRPPLRPAAALRAPDDAPDWEPVVLCLSAEQQARLERKEKREARLQRRNRGKADLYAKPIAKSRPVDPAAARRRAAAALDDSGSEQEAGRAGRRADARRRRR